jgi:uncharacterized protein YndB with AHSA1/START domain
MANFDLSASAVVPTSPERLWALLCETHRYAEWVEGTEAVTRTDGPAVLGSTYEEVNPIVGPWKAKASWTVVEFEPPHRQVHRSEDIPMAAEFLVVMEVEADGDAVKLTHTLRASSSLGPLGAVTFALLERRTRRDNERSVQNLYELACREKSP